MTAKSDDVVGRVKTYEAIIKGDNIPEPGIPESLKVLLKELQSLGLDVKVLREDQTEVEIMETVDYTESEFRYELEGDSKNYDYESESFSQHGYQTQEFDESNGELVSAEDADPYDEVSFDEDEALFEDSLID